MAVCENSFMYLIILRQILIETINEFSLVGDPGFPRRGGEPLRGRKSIIWPIFLENYMKIKKFWPRGFPPPDPRNFGPEGSLPQIRHCSQTTVIKLQMYGVVMTIRYCSDIVFLSNKLIYFYMSYFSNKN